MKNLIVFAVLFFATIPFIHAQKNLAGVGIAVQGFADTDQSFTGVGLFLENRLSRKFSIVAEVDYFGNSRSVITPDIAVEVKSRTLAFQPEIRFYFKEVFRGLFFGTHFSYNSFNNKIEITSQTNPNASIPVEVGASSLVGAGITLGFTGQMTERLGFTILAGADGIFESGNNSSGSKYRFAAKVGYKF